IGALIAIEGAQTLQEYIATGIVLDADVTSQLLINIFIPNTPLHDGAVIIRGNKIATACSYLPLSESDRISKEFGTRHRAAIGLSENSDSLTLVVSEETGGLSVTYKGEFLHDLSREELENFLRDKLIKEEPKKTNLLNQLRGGRRREK
ncbi:diadenylate cyclase, partial [Streptococcus sobrinus]